MIFMVSSAQGITDLFDFLFVSFCRFLFSGLLSCLSFYVSTNDKKIKTKRSRIRGSEDPRTFPLCTGVFSCLANPSSFFSRMNFLAHPGGWIIPWNMGHLIPLLSYNSLFNLNGVTQFEGYDRSSSVKRNQVVVAELVFELQSAQKKGYC